MPPTLTLVVGLPGAGKSTYCRQLARREGITRKESVDDDFLRFGTDGVIARLNAGECCIVNDVTLSTEAERKPHLDRIRRKVPGVVIQWVCFENNPAQCTRNVLADSTRADPKDIVARVRTIWERTDRYEPPEGCILEKVHTGLR